MWHMSTVIHNCLISLFQEAVFDTHAYTNFLGALCGNCNTEFMQNAKECCCCREIQNCLPFIQTFCKGNQGPLKCIIDHPGFPAVCLNRWSLELAADNYKTRADNYKTRSSLQAEWFKGKVLSACHWCLV